MDFFSLFFFRCCSVPFASSVEANYLYFSFVVLCVCVCVGVGVPFFACFPITYIALISISVRILQTTVDLVVASLVYCYCCFIIRCSFYFPSNKQFKYNDISG